MSVQQRISSLTFPPCLTWETERPYDKKDRLSPYFTLKNCKWYLKLKLRAICGCYVFDLYMLQANEQKQFPELTVKTFYEDIGLGKSLLFYERRNVGLDGLISTVPMLKVKEIIRNFEIHGNLRIVCVFEEVGEYIQLSGSQETQSVYFPLKEENPLSSMNLFECSSSITTKQFFSYENLSKDLESLLDKETFPDLQLMVEKTSIPCHKSVLVARSKVFAAMFQHEMTESTTGVLKIKDIDLSSIHLFLKYLYSGKIPDDLTEDQLIKLFETTDKYQVHALQRVSSIELLKRMKKRNCLSYLTLAEAHGDQKFKNAISRYIVKNERLVKSPAWIQFAAENPTLGVEIYRKYVEK